MAKRTPQPFIIAEGEFYQVWREPATREYRAVVCGDLLGYFDRVLEAEEKAREKVYDLLQAGLIGDATLHTAAA